MAPASDYDRRIETMDRSTLDALNDERVRYTVNYANEHSLFYRYWFRDNRIKPDEIRRMKTCSTSRSSQAAPSVSTSCRTRIMQLG